MPEVRQPDPKQELSEEEPMSISPSPRFTEPKSSPEYEAAEDSEGKMET